MMIDGQNDQQQRATRTLLPTVTTEPTYEAYARADKFPVGTASHNALRQVCYDLADTSHAIKKGNPKVVVLKTKRKEV